MDNQENKTLTADKKDSSTSKRPREDEQDVTDDTPECSSEPEKTTSVANPSAKMRRILSNREHARASYLRKKKLIEDLKNSVTTLEEENKRLREENTSLKANQNQSYPSNMGYGSLQGLNPHYPRMSSQAQSLSQRRLALLESLSNPNASRSSPLHLGPLAQNRSWAAEMAASGAPWNDRVAEEMIGGGGMSLPQQQQQQQQLQQLQQQQQQLQQRAALLGNPLHFTPGLSQAQQFAAMNGAAQTPYKTLQDVQEMLHDGGDDVVTAALKDNALRRISD